VGVALSPITSMVEDSPEEKEVIVWSLTGVTEEDVVWKESSSPEEADGGGRNSVFRREDEGGIPLGFWNKYMNNYSNDPVLV
jgi:hypothetical protein